MAKDSIIINNNNFNKIKSEIPYEKFSQIIKEIEKSYEEIVEIYKKAEHNRRICGIIFSIIISKIYKLLLEISQLQSLYKYIKYNNIEKIVKNLKDDFDSTIQILNFPLKVNYNLNSDDDEKRIKADINDLNEYLQYIEGDLTDSDKNVSDIVIHLNALNNTINSKLYDHDEFDEFLPYNDFEILNNDFSSTRKCKRIKNGDNDFVAFKLVNNKNDIIKQVKILSKLEKCHNIIKFYGLIIEDNNVDKWYLVNEWAEYGNLRNYYLEYGPLDVNVKLKFAVDIARGLNFLKSIGMINCISIYAENILITDRETAKIGGNFNSIDYSNMNLERNSKLENLTQYLAPELLNSNSQRYETKSIIYSFGKLLWEIAEEKYPQKRYETFSTNSFLPKEYKEISQKATNDDPYLRPTLAKIFITLHRLYKNDDKKLSSSTYVLKNEVKEKGIIKESKFSDFNYMTLDIAMIQHKLSDGDCNLAFKCFETYSKLGDMRAKYFKAYYIHKKYIKLDIDDTKRDQLIAKLFKEVADLDEYPEAQIRYGYCLYKGIGVKKNLKEALEYYTKAAENHQINAMYNAGFLYFSGDAGKKDFKLGERYMKLAAYHQYKPAMEYCKKHNILL
ncbi:Pkh2p [Rhizophagus irregularis DAOM 197198w]|uniref:non-specific serine/threonine protein kinase n=1 Tax=Rhizophagus irregularis (strain DAOM 197198w) TaxID=1432141 RepID=A0A015JT60_RHIIW|nr:Pkh2p [Rhizophagus irregularis DAOM 197198w]